MGSSSAAPGTLLTPSRVMAYTHKSTYRARGPGRSGVITSAAVRALAQPLRPVLIRRSSPIGSDVEPGERRHRTGDWKPSPPRAPDFSRHEPTARPLQQYLRPSHQSPVGFRSLCCDRAEVKLPAAALVRPSGPRRELRREDAARPALTSLSVAGCGLPQEGCGVPPKCQRGTAATSIRARHLLPEGHVPVGKRPSLHRERGRRASGYVSSPQEAARTPVPARLVHGAGRTVHAASDLRRNLRPLGRDLSFRRLGSASARIPSVRARPAGRARACTRLCFRHLTQRRRRPTTVAG